MTRIAFSLSLLLIVVASKGDCPLWSWGSWKQKGPPWTHFKSSRGTNATRRIVNETAHRVPVNMAHQWLLLAWLLDPLVSDKSSYRASIWQGRILSVYGPRAYCISVTPSNSNRDTIAFCHQGSQSLFNLFQRSIKERSRSPCKRRENHANLWQKQNTDRNRLRIYSILPLFMWTLFVLCIAVRRQWHGGVWTRELKLAHVTWNLRMLLSMTKYNLIICPFARWIY